MSYLDLLIAENRQLFRNPYKLLALLIFVCTCFYGLWKGHSFYKERVAEIEKIKEKKKELVQQASSWLEQGLSGPDDRPWVDVSEPFWAMWYANHHVFDQPAPLMTYSIGQADQFAFYKRVSMWTTGYDPDLIADLHNPEFVGIGALDFTFVWLFLLPVLLIVLLHDVKGLEVDLGFFKTISLHTPDANSWLIKRVSYYALLVVTILLFSLFIPFLFRPISIDSLGILLAYCLAYMLIWFIAFFLVIRTGKGQTDQAIKMVAVWILFAVVLPGGLHQYLNLQHPPNYMMDWVSTKRVEQDEIFALPYDETLERVKAHYSWLPSASALQEDSVSQAVRNSLYRLSLTIEFNQVIDSIIEDLEKKNKAIQAAYVVSPVTFFQNRMNRICGTDYYANRDFRKKVQRVGEEINIIMLRDELANRPIDQGGFEAYQLIDR